MSKELLMIENWFLPLAFVIAGIVLGVIVQTVANRKLAQLAQHPERKGTAVVRENIHGMIIFWFILAGVNAAAHTSPMPEEAHANITKLLFALAVISVTLLVSRIGANHLKLYASRVEGVLPSTSIFVNTLRILILLAGLFTIMDAYGISLLHMVTAMGVAGLATALAIQPTLANLFAGIQILATKQLKVGDYVKLDSGEDGYVTDISWRMTALRTLTSNLIFIPNSKMASATVVNYHMPDKGIDVIVQVSVIPSSDHLVVEQECLAFAKEVMKSVPGGDPDFEPYARFNAISDVSISLTVVLRAKEYAAQFRVRDEFIRRVTARFKKDGLFKSITSVDKHT
jgi:small-conductance mechanosensitive channel